ncbi:MAG TPA: hypothetical protein QF753_18390 [Victivallales bacterium]|nr:hypothetical protein [Victivallales bacterium]
MGNRKIIKSAVNLIILAFIGYFISYLLNICMSNHLKPVLYGDFTATVVAINITTFILLFGADTVVIKYFPTYLKSNNTQLISSFRYWNYRLIRKTFSICIIAFLVLYLVLFLFQIYGIDIKLPKHCAIFILWIAPFSALSVLLSNYILSGRLVSLYYLFNNLAMPFFLLIAFSASALIFNYKLNYMNIIIFILTAYCVVIIIKLFIVKKIFSKVKIKIFKSYKEFDCDLKSEWTSDTIKYFSNKIALTFITSITIIIVQIAGTEKFALGYYSAILSITSVVLLIPMALSSLIKSNAVSLINESKYDELSKILNMTNYINITVCFIVFILIAVFSKTILTTYGKGNEGVCIPLIIQAAAYLISAVFTVPDKLLALINVKAEVKFNIAQLGLLVILGFPMTYYFGLIGITTAILIAVALKSILVFICLKRLLPVKFLIVI